MVATVVPYLVAGVLQIKPPAYTDRTLLSFQIRGNAIQTKQKLNYKSESAAPSTGISPICDEHYHIQRSQCNIFSLSVNTGSQPGQELCRIPSQLLASVPKPGKKETPQRILLTWRFFHRLFYASQGGRGEKGREGPESPQPSLQSLLQKL